VWFAFSIYNFKFIAEIQSQWRIVGCGGQFPHNKREATMNTSRTVDTASETTPVMEAAKAMGRKIEPTAFVSATVGKFYNKV
jgi:hypothetical protein